MGISGKNLEMLFVSSEARGKGYGKTLLECAINKFHITEVDVNEQNRQAVGFYEKFGFSVVGRSEKDSMGKDYPILHLKLNKSTFNPSANLTKRVILLRRDITKKSRNR